MKHLLTATVVMLVLAGAAQAYPVDVYSEEDPTQDPIFMDGPCHELGDGFPADPVDQRIISSHVETDERSCPELPDDPGIPNYLVSITNLTDIFWTDLHYVVDPETSINNYDGFIGNAGLGDAQLAFRIDNVGVNVPLVGESMTPDLVFEPGETWDFILQDFANALGNPTPFDSLGIAGVSSGVPQSTGSIIAVPEPATLSLLAFGGVGVLLRKRRKT
ncbi:MAG: PEP-CTERM sorting domain-containing protein [Planctomycetes bacterium]|jgi:hypothetical protein|nr:PEP-CTERM sorting domain-containing protein [Planctomycetota bacterium]